MSVLWELDAETLAVTKVWYGRTIIRSSYQLHYELAQALLNGEPAEVPELETLTPEEKDAKLAELTQALETLTHVARHLRAQRDRGGALELEGVEVGVVTLQRLSPVFFTYLLALTPGFLLRCALSWTRRRTSPPSSPVSPWRSTRPWPSA